MRLARYAELDVIEMDELRMIIERYPEAAEILGLPMATRTVIKRIPVGHFDPDDFDPRAFGAGLKTLKG